MQIQIDNASDRPVYQQIIDQVKRDIALGRLKPEEKLPTVRELAGQLAINPNTIGKAYSRLEREGIITTRPGSGAFVADFSTNLSMAVRRKIICADIERLLVEAVHMQIEKDTLNQWFKTALDKFNFPQRKG
jgi:GntR family transcriptional regulator